MTERPTTPGGHRQVPLSRALGHFAVEDPEVVELLDLSTGRFERHADVIGDDYEKALQLRMQLQTDLRREQPRFVCAMCMTPVYLVSRPEGRKFFSGIRWKTAAAPR